MWRADCRAHVEPETAVAEAEEVLQDEELPASFLCLAARVFAQSSVAVEDPQKRERYAERAVALLREARDCGQFQQQPNIETLKTERRLDSLRLREDFKKLLAELEGESK